MNRSENMTLKGTMDIKSKVAKRRSMSQNIAVVARWSLLIAMILSPWAFGSVHHWAQRGIAVCLLVGLGIYWFETALDTGKRKVLPYVALFVVGGIFWGLLQLWPMPASMSGWVLGRQQEIYQSYSGQPPVAPRASLNPEETWGQLRLLMMGLAGLLLGCRYFRSTKNMVTLLTVGTANGVLISFLGILQKLTWEGQIFWAYTVRQGTPFGPFVNRNNGAGFLLMSLACCIGLIPIVMSRQKNSRPVPIISREMPIWRQLHSYLVYFVSELTATKLSVLLCAGIIATGIVASLSRGGVTAMLFGGIVTILIYGMSQRPKNVMVVVLPILFVATSLAVWLSFSDLLLERFENRDVIAISDANMRVKNWRETQPAIFDMGLLGAGLGSYRQVHRLYSTGPELKLFEYAENQFFQAAVESGWVGLLLFCAAWIVGFWYALHLLYRGKSAYSVGVGTFGFFLLASQIPASCFDFGLYVPANVLQMSVLVGLLGYHAQSHTRRLKKPGLLRFECPNWAAQILLLVLFAGLTLAALDLHRRTRLDALMVPDSKSFNTNSMPLSETEIRIENVSSILKRCSSVEGMNYLGELWIHRARLMYMDSIQDQEEYRNAELLLNEEEKKNLSKNTWAMTSLQLIQENANYLRREVSRYQARRFLGSSFIQENLPIAMHFFHHSRRAAPLQPVVHLRLGQLAGAMGESARGGEAFEDGIELAPNNPQYRRFAAVYYLQEGDAESAAQHLKTYLTLVPGKFRSVFELVSGKTPNRIEPVPPKEIFKQIIPDNPNMLFQFARSLSEEDADVKMEALERADELLGEGMPGKREKVMLRAEIRLAKGETDLAIEAFLAALKYNPMDQKTQFRVASLLDQQGRFQEAFMEAKKLLRFDRRNGTYNKLIQNLEQKLSQDD